MGEELQKLKLRPPMDGKLGRKKTYFLQNLDLIFDLIENHRAKYPDILAAMSREGMDFSYIYFRELMAEAKQERSGASLGKSPGAATKAKSTTTSPAAKPVTQPNNNEDMTPEKSAFIAENQRIKNLKISSKEKREMLKKASDEYLKTQNPLDRS